LKYQRLMLIFLINTSTFLDPQVDELVLKLFNYYIERPKPLNFESSLGGKFYDSVIEFLEQFQSASFGNKTFAKFLHYLLRMEYDSKYRHLIWNELRDVLQLLSVEPQVNVDGYFYPIETSSDVLLLYESCLVSGQVTIERNQFLYWIAIHHLSCFIFGQDNGSLDWIKKQIMRNILVEGSKEVFEHIINYIPTIPISLSTTGPKPNTFRNIPSRIQFLKDLCKYDSEVERILGNDKTQ